MSHMHKPPKHLSKGSGCGKEIILWSFEQNGSDIKLKCVLNNSANMRNISSNIIIVLGSKHFTSENGVMIFFFFEKKNCL